MKLRRLAQSTILLTTRSGSTLLIDPGKYNLDPGRLSVASFPPARVVVITHKHADHFDPPLVKSLFSRDNPTFITNGEIQNTLEADGIHSRVVKPGDSLEIEGFSLEIVPADHVVRGELIVNFGLVVRADGVSLYHTSDTRFIDPAQLPPATRSDYLLVPISNRGVVMGIDDAAVFSSELKPRLAVPVHYDSPKDTGRVDPAEFVAKSAKLGVTARVLAFGEELEL